MVIDTNRPPLTGVGAANSHAVRSTTRISTLRVNQFTSSGQPSPLISTWCESISLLISIILLALLSYHSIISGRTPRLRPLTSLRTPHTLPRHSQFSLHPRKANFTQLYSAARQQHTTMRFASAVPVALIGLALTSAEDEGRNSRQKRLAVLCPPVDMEADVGRLPAPCSGGEMTANVDLVVFEASAFEYAYAASQDAHHCFGSVLTIPSHPDKEEVSAKLPTDCSFADL